MQRRRRITVTLRDLISTRILPVGTTFSHGDHVAVVDSAGLRVDGALYEEPSPAARAVNGNTEVNGWKYWRGPFGVTLADYRRRHPFGE